MVIGSFDTSTRVLVVAEIGNNHEGRFEVAAELVRTAAECGAHAVKFQTFRTELFVSADDRPRYERLRSFELTHEQFGRLAALARSLGLLVLATPLDLGSAAFLDGVVDAFKIASGDNTFFPLLAQVAATGKPVIVSTGLADLSLVERTVAFINAQWAQRGQRGQLALLHCVSAYPADPDQVNLAAIRELASLGVTVGYSDHTTDIEASVLAVVLGARIVEKHFTLDKQFSAFRDHQLSADPPQFRELVARVEMASRLTGTGGKRVQPSEAPGVVAFRRSIAAGRDLAAGHVLETADLAWVRPAGGLPPGEEHQLLGRALVRAVRLGERLGAADVRSTDVSH